MHQSSMFAGRPQQAPVAAPIEPYDLQAIAHHFAAWSFGLGAPWDQHTPQITIATIKEIQDRAMERGHPLRVGMFNIMSENGFDNAQFQDLVYVIIVRAAHGMANGEFRNISLAVNTCIQRCVKACGSALAAGDQEFMNTTFKPEDQKPVYENAEIWNYLVALAQGQVQFMPFSAMDNSTGGVGLVSGSLQDALSAARNLRGTTAGAFNEGGDYGITQSPHNNNASRSVGRYGRRAQKVMGKMEGSLQEALYEGGFVAEEGAQQQATAAHPMGQAPSYQSRMRRPAMRPNAAGSHITTPPANPQAAAAAQKFDSDVTDFSKSLENVTPAQPAKQPEETVMFDIQVGDQKRGVVKEVADGLKLWKPTSLQHFLPAYCTRTHQCRFFKLTSGEIVAILVPLSEQQKELAMDYDAHAIDPTKGKPDPEVPKRPVRPEAKVLYTDSKNVTINLKVAEKMSMEEDVSGAIRSARQAELAEEVPDAFTKKAIVNTSLVYATAEEAEEDLVTLKAIGASKTFEEAIEYMSRLKNPLARTQVDAGMVAAINRAMRCELGINIKISDFREDGPQIIGVVAEHHGALMGEKLKTAQKYLLAANVIVKPADEVREFANQSLAGELTKEAPLEEGETEVRVDESVIRRVLFLQRNVATVWVNFTDDELAVGKIPETMAATISPDSLGALYEIAKSVFVEVIGTQLSSEQFLVTKDGVVYGLHRGLINREAYLLSRS